MHRIKIWQALPSEISPNNRIADIQVLEHGRGSANRLFVKAWHLGSSEQDCFCVDGSTANESVLRLVADIVTRLDDASNRSADVPMQLAPGEHSGLVLTVESEADVLPEELARLTVVPDLQAPYQYHVTWSRVGEVFAFSMTVRFFPFSVGVWMVLRAVSALLLSVRCAYRVDSVQYLAPNARVPAATAGGVK